MLDIPIDYETRLISAEHPAPKPVCLSLVDEQGPRIVIGAEIETTMKRLLQDTDIRIIAHNMKFEMLVTYEWFPALREDIWKAYEEKRLVCTFVNEKVIANFDSKKPQKKFDLATLVKKYLKEDISGGKKGEDSWRLRYQELEGIEVSKWPQEAIDYSIQDSEYALKVNEHQSIYNLTYESTRADFVLGLAANEGMLTDQGRIEKLEKEIIEKLTPEYKFLIENNMGHRCTLTNKFKKHTKELQNLIEENISNVSKTPKGNVRTTNEALSNYIPTARAHPNTAKIIGSFCKLSAYEKILSTFVPAFKKAIDESEGIVRTNYNPVVNSGRTSSFGSKLYPSLNIQQMPREVAGISVDVRGCFKAREGYKLVSIDYGGLELCVTAHQLYKYLGYSKMREYLNEGDYPTDLHSRFAARVMSTETNTNVSYDHFVEHKHEKKFGSYRQICKALNLGFPGGIGYVVMATQLLQRGIEIKKTVLKDGEGKEIIAVSEAQANFFVKLGREKNLNIRAQRIGKRAWMFVADELVGLKEEYFNMYPEVRDFLKDRHEDFLTGEFKWRKNDFDEYKKEPLYKFESRGIKRDYAMYTQFCNSYLMQTPSAQGAKEMLWNIGQNIRNNPDVRLKAFIHDEIILEIAENGQFEENVNSAAQIMLLSMQNALPSVRLNIEAVAMKHWSKAGDGSFERLYWLDPGKTEVKHA